MNRNNYSNDKIAIEKLFKRNERYNIYTSIYNYHEKLSSSRDVTSKNVVFDRLVFDFDLEETDENLLKLNGYNAADLKELDEDKIKELANDIRIKENESLAKCTSEDDIRKYFQDKYEHEYLSQPINEVKRVAKWFKDNFGVEPVLFFSSGKGVHGYWIFNPIKINNVDEVVEHIAFLET